MPCHLILNINLRFLNINQNQKAQKKKDETEDQIKKIDTYMVELNNSKSTEIVHCKQFNEKYNSRTFSTNSQESPLPSTDILLSDKKQKNTIRGAQINAFEASTSNQIQNETTKSNGEQLAIDDEENDDEESLCNNQFKFIFLLYELIFPVFSQCLQLTCL